MGSNLTQGMEVKCLCLSTGRGLATSWSPVQEFLPTDLDLVTDVKRKVHGGGQGLNWAVEPKGKKYFIDSSVLHFTRNKYLHETDSPLVALLVKKSRVLWNRLPCP
jgi:hypothetical protein